MKLRVLTCYLSKFFDRRIVMSLVLTAVSLRIYAIPDSSMADSTCMDTALTVSEKTVFPKSPAENSAPKSGVRLFATTNLLYDAALTPNVGLGVCITDRLSIMADWMFARWGNHDKRRYWRIYGGDVDVKYHVGNIRKNSPLGGHHIGVYASLACYDFQAGLSHTGVLSDKYNYAVGVSYTYTLPIASRLNIDFNLGVGYLWGKFKKHTPMDDCDVWLSTHSLRWIGPTRVGVSLVWLLGDPCANRGKGGER